MKRVVFPIIGIFLIAFSAFSQEILTADRFLASVADKYGTLKDYAAKLSILSGESQMQGTIIHRRPNLLRIDFSDPVDQVIAYNGETLTVYLPEYRAVLSQETSASGKAGSASLASAQGLATLRRNYVASFEVGPTPIPLDEKSPELVIKLLLSRRSLSEGFRELTLSVIPDTLLIRRIEGRTIADQPVRLDFTGIVLDQGIPEARFAYDSPASANLYNNFLFKETD